MGLGGSLIRAAATLDGLAADHDVTVVLVGTVGRVADDELEAGRRHTAAAGARWVDARTSALGPRRGAAAVALRGTGGRLERAVHLGGPPGLVEQAAGADLVWVLKTLPFQRAAIPRHPCTIVDLDDLDERAEVDAPARARALHRLTRRRLAARSRLLVVCSDTDLRRLGRSHGRVLENTAPPPPAGRPPTDVGRADREPVVLLTGRMRYGPNAEGARWFLRAVWPRVRAAMPTARFRVVGAGAVEELGAHAGDAGVDLVGPVDELAPELDQAAVTVAPVLTGSGTRVKIIEALAWQRPVVSTSLGAEGLATVAGHHLLVADDPGAFAASVVALLTDPERRATLATAGRELYEERYAPHHVHERVRQLAAEARHPGPVAGRGARPRDQLPG